MMKFRKILSVFLAIIILAGMLGIGIAAVDIGDVQIEQLSENSYLGDVQIEQLSENSYLGKDALAAMDNASNLLFVYDCIKNGIANSAARINVTDGIHYVSIDDLNIAFTAYHNDHPQSFWITGGYKYYYNAIGATAIEPAYIMSGSALSAAVTEFETRVQKYLEGITSSMSEYERESIIHDRLCRNVDYDLKADYMHTSYGAIVGGKAVCDGYAKAFQYLLYRSGIQSHVVTGTANGGGHAWNLVKIDGKYYQVDATWDDQDTKIFHTYFNITDEQIFVDHNIDDPGYPLPECTSDHANFYFINSSVIGNTFSIDTIANLLKNGNMTAEVYVSGNQTAFLSWINSNIAAIGAKAGVAAPYYYTYSNLGRSYMISLVTNVPKSVSGVITSFGSDIETLYIDLIPAGSNTAAYSTATVGNSASYTFSAVKEGDYKVLITKRGSAVGTFDISVGSSNLVQNFKIYLIGDINMNGRIDGTDSIILSRYLAGWSGVSVDVSIADFNGDKKTTDMDMIIFLRYLAGWENVSLYK